MGCNGEELFVKSEDNDFMNMFQKLNGDINDYTQELDFAEPIDWINDSENANISTVYLPTEKANVRLCIRTYSTSTSNRWRPTYKARSNGTAARPERG